MPVYSFKLQLIDCDSVKAPVLTVLVTETPPPVDSITGVPVIENPVVVLVSHMVAVVDPLRIILPFPKLIALTLLLLLEKTGTVNVFDPNVKLPAVKVYPEVLVVVKLALRFKLPLVCVTGQVTDTVVPPVLMRLADPEITVMLPRPVITRLLTSKVPLVSVKARVEPMVALLCSDHVPPMPLNVKGQSYKFGLNVDGAAFPFLVIVIGLSELSTIDCVD